MAFRKPGTFLLEEGLQALRSCRQTHRWKEPLLDPSEGHPDMAEVLVAPAEGASQARDACEGPGHALSLQGDPRSRARQDAHHDRRGRALREVPGVPRRRAVPHRGLGGARRPARGQWTVQDHPGLPGRTAPLRRADATRVRLQAPHLDPGVADARPRRAGRGRDQHRRHEPTPGPVEDRAEAAQAGREMPLEGRAAEAAVAANRAAGEAPARRRGRRLRRRGRHPSQPRGRAGLDEAWSTEGGGDARTQREALPRRRVGPPGAPTHLCRRRAEEQPAVPATALQAGHEELPERQADPCNPRQLRHPRQRAGAAGDEVGGGGAVGAPLPAAVLPGPQPDRAHLEGPARQRHPQPPLRVDGGAHGRGALLLGGSKPLRAPHVCPDEEGMTRRAPQSRKAIYLFKEDLQRLVDRIGIEIRVAHYPPYASKYNPIEHRLFPHLTRACQGVIFHTVGLVKGLLEKAKTSTGLEVTVDILDKMYQTGRKYAADFKETMKIVFDEVLPKWNYRAIPSGP